MRHTIFLFVYLLVLPLYARCPFSLKILYRIMHSFSAYRSVLFGFGLLPQLFFGDIYSLGKTEN